MYFCLDRHDPCVIICTISFTIRDMMQDHFIKKEEINRLFEYLATRFDVYVINRKDENLFWRRLNLQQIGDVIINEYRPAEPLKSFIFKPKEKVLDEFKDFESRNRPLAVVGAKACDLRALKILDHVFMEGDFKDPFYIKMREENLIISADCTSFREVCFCLGIGVEPFPEENFDLNFSELKDGYVIAVGSAKGQKVLDESNLSMKEVTDTQRKKLRENRDSFSKKLQSSIDFMNLPPKDSLQGGIRSNFKSELWDNFTSACVECGGCNVICPTCHCFLLVDQASDDTYQRLKVWDSCLMKRFARVAGGANPRKHLNERLRNRFVKKFDFFPEILGLYACTGCGRCIEACPGDIDLREVLKEACKETR